MRYHRAGNRIMHWARLLPMASPWRLIVALLIVAIVGWAGTRPTMPDLRALGALRVGGWGPVYTVAALERRIALAPDGWE